MNQYDNYVVYRQLTIDPYTNEVSSKLVVVDNDRKAKEYLKWMFGPKTEFDIVPQNATDILSSMSENYMLVDVIVDFWKGPRYRSYIPVKMFSEGKFYNGFFRGIVNQLTEKVLEDGKTVIRLSEFYDVLRPESIVDELEAVEVAVGRPVNLEEDW